MDSEAGISWYFKKPSDVLFVDEERFKVGVLNSNPNYQLDVTGTVKADAYIGLPAFALSNNIYPMIINTSNTAYWASNNLIPNGETVTLSNLVVLSNLSTQIISRNGSNVLDTDGKIDYKKWLKNAPEYGDDGALAVAGVVLGTLGILTGAGAVVLDQFGKTGTALLDDLKDRVGADALDDNYDPDDAENENLRTHWNNIIYKPLYQNIGKEEIGIGSNLYIARGSSIYSVDKSELVAYDAGRTRRIANNPATIRTIYDTVTDSLVCKYVLASSNVNVGNITATKALQTSNITSSNITATSYVHSSNITAYNNMETSNLAASNVQVGNTYVTATGMYAGNPNNPFTSYQFIDAYGNYKGTITKEQITNLETLNLNKLSDGLVEWSGFKSSGNPFIDPFASTGNPLFQV